MIITLILLSLLGAASIAMILLVNSDMMVNGYYRNYRGSFYAADSGVNVVVQAMSNAVLAAATQTGNPPLPTGATAIPTTANTWTAATLANGSGAYPAGLTTAYTNFQGSYFTIGDLGSWKGQFKLLAANANGQPILGIPQFDVETNPRDSYSCLPVTAATCLNGQPNASGQANTHDYIWQFTYPYTITLQGQSYGNEAEQITQTGTVVYTSTSGNPANSGPPPFSKWGAFITNFSDCQGPLTPGTMSGPFFTDGQWNFGNFTNPGYTFAGTVQQAGGNVSWWKNNKCTDVTGNTVPNGFTSPNFQKGLQTGANPVVPPSDTYSQAQAVLDAKGDPPCTAAPCPVGSAPTQAQMNQTLKTLNGTAYPSSGSAPNGVYVPWYVDSSGAKRFGSNPANGGDGAGGGFYINGNASSINLSATTTGNGANAHPTETYTINQNGTVTTIVVDNVLGTTMVTSGGTTLSLQGVPTQLDPTTGQPVTENDPSGNLVNPTMLYVNGQVQGLSGTIQNDTGITIATSYDVSITGDLTYVSSPVSIPADTLISNTNAGVLGVYTQGNINLYPNSSGSNQGNLTVDASLAALSGQTGSNANSGFYTPGTGINSWTIVGGRSEDHAHSVNIGAGNTYYDQRFANNFGPPWFPTAVPQPGELATPASQSVKVTRTSWQENR